MVSYNTNLQGSFLSRLQRYSIFLKYANKNRFWGDFLLRGADFSRAEPQEQNRGGNTRIPE